MVALLKERYWCSMNTSATLLGDRMNLELGESPVNDSVGSMNILDSLWQRNRQSSASQMLDEYDIMISILSYKPIFSFLILLA